MRFNINDLIRVKLTPLGRLKLEEEHSILFAPYRAAGGYMPYTPPKEDAEGWSTWQMWYLFAKLGQHHYNGSPFLFETEIELIGVEK